MGANISRLELSFHLTEIFKTLASKQLLNITTSQEAPRRIEINKNPWKVKVKTG